MRRFILLLILSGSIFFRSTFAQTSLKAYDWDPYKTEFKIPDDFKVDENSGEKFMASGPGFNFTIYPKKNESLSLGGMKTAVKKWAEDNGLTNTGEVTVLDESKYHGYWGVFIDGVKNDFPVTQVLLVHPKDNSISFYVWLSYSASKKYLADDLLQNIIPITPASEQSSNLIDYTWKNYKTKFKIPDDFKVNESTGEKFYAGNSRMSLTIYPRKGENLSAEEREKNLRKWAEDNNLKNPGKVTILDSEKLNGYWGVFVEGTRNDDPEIYMLIINPNDSAITMYVNLAYKVGLEDLAMDILKSIAPMTE